MSTVIVTGSGGLVGSQTVRHFGNLGWDVVGVDNDMRKYFFGEEASTSWMIRRLGDELTNYRHVDADIRDGTALEKVVRDCGSDLELVVHAAAQPSHDWAAREPMTDFNINAGGTLALLEAVRTHRPSATFVFMSTNKVYGDTPNRLPLVESATRWELPPDHSWWRGVPEDMSIDQSTHSIFGVSKAAADLMVQEYGRYFGMATVTFRGGCLTGSGHSGAELHGFLAYLVRCAATRKPYTVFGYRGKQVRDNIHSLDLVSAFEQVARDPHPGAVYNMGGGRASNCSMLEAIAMCEEITGRPMQWSYDDESRVGDHMWWISDLSKFQHDYPLWQMKYGVKDIVSEIYEANAERWRMNVE